MPYMDTKPVWSISEQSTFLHSIECACRAASLIHRPLPRFCHLHYYNLLSPDASYLHDGSCKKWQQLLVIYRGALPAMLPFFQLTMAKSLLTSQWTRDLYTVEYWSKHPTPTMDLVQSRKGCIVVIIFRGRSGFLKTQGGWYMVMEHT